MHQLTLSCCHLLISLIIGLADHSQETKPTIDVQYDTISVHPSLPNYIIEWSDSTFDVPGEPSHRSKYVIHQIGNDTISQTIEWVGYWPHEYEVIDVNFDGYKDLKISGDPEQLSSPSDVWLFNPTRGLFELSEEFSGHYELTVIPEEKKIYTQRLLLGGRGGDNATYRVEKGHLKLIERTVQDGDEITRHALIGGNFTLVESKTYEDSWLVHRKFIDDSLRIISRVKKVAKDEATHDDQISGIEDRELWGDYLLLREELYEYTKSKGGKRFVNITIREARDHKWKIVTHRQKAE